MRSADQTGLKATRDNIDSAAVTKRLEEELSKRDALIEVVIHADCVYVVHAVVFFS